MVGCVIGIPDTVIWQIEFGAILQCYPKLPSKCRIARQRVELALQRRRYFLLPVSFPGAISTEYSSEKSVRIYSYAK